MVGKKRQAGKSSGRESRARTRVSHASAPTVTRAGSSIYREMLAEAGISQSTFCPEHDDIQEPASKRRRPGDKRRPEQEESLAATPAAPSPPLTTLSKNGSSDQDDEQFDFIDVSLPPAQVQTIERDSEDDESDEDDDDDDDEDLVFEDVVLNVAAPEKSKDVASEATVSDFGKLELNLTAQKAASRQLKGNAARRKPMTREERERRVNIHKMHLLCLLSHAARRNHWCNDRQVQDKLRLHLSGKTADYLMPGSHLPQFGQAESLKTGLKQAADMWCTKYEVTERGLRRARWAEDMDQLEEYRLPQDLETCMDRQDFRQAATRLQGSRDVGAQLYCALLRSVGVQARLLCSLQPLSFGNGAPTLPKISVDKFSSSSKAKRSEELHAQVLRYREMAETATVSSSSSSSTASTARRRLGHPNAAGRNFEPQPSPSPTKPQKTFATPVRIRESAYPVYWVEVLDTGHQKWQPADPLVTHTFWKPRAMEPPITDKENCLSYVVAFDEDGTARDVTVRYAKAFAAKTRRLRVDGTEDGGWWRKAMGAFRRRQRTDLDQIEDSELAGVESREAMPRNVQDFKDHPVYALQRHLRRHEVLVPNAMPSGTVSSGNKGPLEKIYRRRDVEIARSADKWFRMGREVRLNEIPAKWLPKVKRTPKKGGGGRDFDHGDDDVRTAAGADAARSATAAAAIAEDAAGVPIYREDQTEVYVPAAVQNGRVPKNKFGNVEIFVASMVPRGGVHVVHEQAGQAARLVGVDYAPALTGFRFEGRRGTAVFSGIVVAEEFAEAVGAVLEGMEEAERTTMEDRRAAAAVRRWRRFLVALRIRERIWSGVDEEEEKEEEEKGAEVEEMGDGVLNEADAEESHVSEEFDMVMDGEDADEYGGGFMAE